MLWTKEWSNLTKYNGCWDLTGEVFSAKNKLVMLLFVVTGEAFQVQNKSIKLPYTTTCEIFRSKASQSSYLLHKSRQQFFKFNI